MTETVEHLDEVAIIGMVCRFPGAQNVDEFWRNLRDGVESISFFTDEELLASGVPAGRIKHPDYVKARGILDGIEMFDPSFFGMMPREAQIIDPQQRLFLECAHEALESAGYNPDTYPGAIGVYAGTGLSEYFLYNYSRPQLQKMLGGFQGVLGNDKDYLTTRVSYKLNLNGPSINVNTACSTSLVAVALACQSLLNAECDIALAGGVSIFYPQKVGHFHQEGGVNSPDGHCRPFDAKAEGTVGGNGVGIVVLKRLADAIADGDHIHAVVKGAALNNDGAAKVGYTAPSVNGQAKVIGEAMAMANVEPESISYVETHGTATPLGDPIEIAALTKVFRAGTPRKQFCALGSVKSNIGHLDAAAGVAGLIKTALALEHQLIPASLHYQAPNPKIDFENSPFFVNAAPRAWVRNGQPRRAGVSSFGIGGTNAHLVLEEAPPRPATGSGRGSELLVLSAKTASALEQATQNLAQYLKQHPEANLADVAYTSAVGRRAFAQRRIVIARDVAEAIERLLGQQTQGVWSRSVEPKFRPVHFLFSGQGSQQVNMGRHLYERQRVYRETVDRCAELVARETGLDVRTVLFAEPGTEAAARAQLQQTAVTQPALFITEYALVKQWQHWGVKPQGMLGHSLGEFVAACVAGVLSEAEALRLVTVRARLMQQQQAGAMLSVGLSEEATRALSRGRVDVAALNGAELTVLAGTIEAITEIEQELKADGIWHRRLETSHAFHSELMEPMLDEYRAVVSQVQLREPQQRYVSSVTGEWIDGSEVQTVDYWVRQVREPVRFWAGLETLKREGESVVVEVGPGKALTTLARAVWGADAVVVPTLGVADEQTSEAERVSAAVGQVWLGGVDVDWQQYYSEERRARVTLPTYPFERQRCLLEAPPEQTPPAEKVEEQNVAIEKKVLVMSTATENIATQTSRKDHICSILKKNWSNLMGLAPDKLDPHATFFELGVDSLLLIQVSQSISSTFEVKIPFRRLMEEFTTLTALATYLDDTLPPEKFRPEIVVATQTVALEPAAVQTELTLVQTPTTQELSVSVSNVPHENGNSHTGGSLEQIIAQQIQVMSLQLDLLRNPHQANQLPIADNSRVVSAAISMPSLPPVAENGNGKHVESTMLTVVEQTEKITSAKTEPEVFVPYAPIKPGTRGGFTPKQQQHLDDLTARYNKRTAGSKQHTARHRAHLSDNRALIGFRLPWKELVYPIVGRRSSGSRIWDVDGNEYVDFTMGFGVHFLGHSPSFVVGAIEEQLKQGIHLGPQSEVAGEVAALISEMIGMERVAFVNSGTEAVMSAIRMARAVTGRTRIASFGGSYHGTFDGTLGRIEKNPAGGLRTVPITQGVVPGMVEDLLMVYYDRPESLDVLRAEAGNLAAVLVEPVQSRRPDIQPKEFLRELREITAKSGTALIFDEMITGFRIHPGGAQAHFGIQADLATYGKLIGGGLPIGVVAGKGEYLDAIDGGLWSYGDNSYPMADQTIFAGTFCKNPLSMAAARAVLQHLKASGPGLQEKLNERADAFVAQLNALLTDNEVPMKVVNFGSLIRFLLLGGNKNMELFFYHLVDKGVFIWEGRTAFLSTAHTDADIDFIFRAFAETIEEMRAGGFLPERPGPKPGGDWPGKIYQTPGVTIPAPTSLVENERRPVARCIPVTEAQKELWVLAQVDPEASRAYNESMTFSIRGVFDPGLMRNALHEVIARHEALHSAFSDDGESLIVGGSDKLPIPLIDLSKLPAAQRQTEVTALVAQHAGEAFDLSRGPLVRASLVRLEPDHHLLVLTIHHTVFDGWSSSVLLQELHALYMGEKTGAKPKLAAALKLDQYVNWQTSQAQCAENAEAENYWLQRYARPAPALDLPVDRTRPAVRTYRGARERRALSADIYDEVKSASVRLGSTLLMVLLGGFNLLLHRLSDQDDVVVGIHSAGQSSLSGGSLIGYCINLLPLRSQISKDQTFANYLQTMRGQLLDAYEHQNYPFSKLIKKLQVRRDPSRSPLVAAVFNVDRSAAEVKLFGADVEITTNHPGFSKWEVSWNIVDMGDEFIVECDYNSDLYDPQTIQRWIRQYETLLATAVRDSGLTLAELDQAVAETEIKQRSANVKELKSVNLQRLRAVQREAGSAVG